MTEPLICCGLCDEFSEFFTGNTPTSGLCYVTHDYVECMESHPDCFHKSLYVGEKALTQIALTLKPKTSQDLIKLVTWRDEE